MQSKSKNCQGQNMQEKKEFEKIEMNTRFIYKGFVFIKRSSFSGFSSKFGELFIQKEEIVETYEGSF